MDFQKIRFFVPFFDMTSRVGLNFKSRKYKFPVKMFNSLKYTFDFCSLVSFLFVCDREENEFWFFSLETINEVKIVYNIFEIISLIDFNRVINYFIFLMSQSWFSKLRCFNFKCTRIRYEDQDELKFCYYFNTKISIIFLLRNSNLVLHHPLFGFIEALYRTNHWNWLNLRFNWKLYFLFNSIIHGQ